MTGSGRQQIEPPVTVPGLEHPQPIGRGGFGTVYRAWQSRLGREVALKVDSRVLVDERDRRRFLREASAAGQLSGHGHIVGVYDAGMTADGRPYLVMELCPGGSLAERVLATGPIPAAEACRIGIGIADALATAHAAGILHRDVKPGNILVDRYGVAKLADFGLAALLDASGDSSVTLEALTPAYAPPEAFAFVRPAPAGDVYALAATLYALLAGRPPRVPSWPPRSFAELSADLRAPVPPLPGVPPELNEALARALATDPDARTAGAAEFRDALRAVPELPPAPRSGRHRSPDAHPSGPAQAGWAQPAQLTATASAPPTAPGLPHPSLPTGWPPAGPLPAGYAAGPAAYPAAGPMPAGAVPAGVAPVGVGRGPGGPPGSARRGRRRLLAVAAVVVVAGGAGLAIMLAPQDQDGSGPTARGPFPTGAATSPGAARPAGGLPAGLVGCAGSTVGALCPTAPTCWYGLIENGGHKVAAQTIPCTEPHHWEAYAAGRLSADPAVQTAAEITARPEVTAVCTSASRAARTRPGVNTTGWTLDVQPQQFAGRGWYFYCVARPPDGAEPSRSNFITGPG
ncbi:MAG TPA: protein kinase [Mycobacteriales bacterium]|nr:protein kinase [Mycobacteriales bacterium]